MARQNVPLPILTIEQVAPFFWVSLWDCGRRMCTRWMEVQDFYRVAIEGGDDGGDQVCAKAAIR